MRIARSLGFHQRYNIDYKKCPKRPPKTLKVSTPCPPKSYIYQRKTAKWTQSTLFFREKKYFFKSVTETYSRLFICLIFAFFSQFCHICLCTKSIDFYHLGNNHTHHIFLPCFPLFLNCFACFLHSSPACLETFLSSHSA